MGKLFRRSSILVGMDGNLYRPTEYVRVAGLLCGSIVRTSVLVVIVVIDGRERMVVHRKQVYQSMSTSTTPPFYRVRRMRLVIRTACVHA
jgi:hypothetical protein